MRSLFIICGINIPQDSHETVTEVLIWSPETTVIIHLQMKDAEAILPWDLNELWINLSSIEDSSWTINCTHLFAIAPIIFCSVYI